jgi:hypothetical protein
MVSSFTAVIKIRGINPFVLVSASRAIVDDTERGEK